MRYDIVSLHLYVVVLRIALRLQSIAVIPDCQVLSWQLDEEKNWKIYTVRQSYVHIIGVVRSNGDDSSTWCTTAFDRRPGNNRERNGPSVCPYLCVSIRLSVSPGAELVLGRFGSLLWDGRWTLWHPALKVWTLISIHHHLSAFFMQVQASNDANLLYHELFFIWSYSTSLLFIQSIIVSLCLPRVLVPSILPSKTVRRRNSLLNTWPKPNQ